MDIATAAILEVTKATRQISQEASHSSTRVHREGDNFSFSLPENSPVAQRLGLGLGLRMAQHFIDIKKLLVGQDETSIKP